MDTPGAADYLQPTSTWPSRQNGIRQPWLDFLAHLLFVLAAWTLFIKYLFPVGFAFFQGEPLTRHVYRDLWPIAHIWLGWALLTKPGFRSVLMPFSG